MTSGMLAVVWAVDLLLREIVLPTRPPPPPPPPAPGPDRSLTTEAPSLPPYALPVAPAAAALQFSMQG
jgi:hypothetical protein